MQTGSWSRRRWRLSIALVMLLQAGLIYLLEKAPTAGPRPTMVVPRIHLREQVLVVAHGTAINCMLSEVLGMALTHTFRFDVANCGLTRLALVGHRLVVATLNDVSHLSDVQGKRP